MAGQHSSLSRTGRAFAARLHSWRFTPARRRSRRSRLAKLFSLDLNLPARGPFRAGKTGPELGRPARSHHARRKGRSTSGTSNTCGVFVFALGTVHFENPARSIIVQSQAF